MAVTSFVKVRKVDTLFGVLFVLITGCAGTYAIVHTIQHIPASYLSDEALRQDGF